MVNPRPLWVSVVDKGANQTPFNVLKNHKGERIMKKAKIKLVKKGNIPTAVRKLVFAKAQFADEAAVTKYLDQHNWEGYTITSKGNTFEAAAEDVTDANFSVIKSVKLDTEGVTGYVGHVKLDTVEAEEVTVKGAKGGAGNADTSKKKPMNAKDNAKDSAKKGKGKGGDGDAEDDVDGGDDEDTEDGKGKVKGKAKKTVLLDDLEGEEVNTRKFDFWNAYLSKESTLKGVMEDGMSDGLPPGIDTIMQSMYTAVSNVLKSDLKKSKKASAVQQIGSEFAEIVLAVDDVYEELIGAEDATKAEKAYTSAHDAFIAEHADESAKKDLSNGKAADDAEPVNANVCKLLEKLIAKVDAIGETATEANTNAKKANDEVATLKGKAPTKKGSSIDVVEDEVGDNARKADDTEAKAQKAFDEKMSRNLLGISMAAH